MQTPSQKWKKFKIGKLLVRANDTLAPVSESSYTLVTVKLYGKGVIPRCTVAGSEIKSNRMFRVKEGQFILSRIDARNGAFGIIPPELRGALVTNDFPVFDVNADLLEPSYLNWMAKTVDFVDMCRQASKGTTNRVRLQEDLFADMEIPLPPIPEQRSIIARIERLVSKVDEAKGLRHAAVVDAEALMGAAYDGIFNWEKNAQTTALLDSGIKFNQENRNPSVEAPSSTFTYIDISSVKSGDIIDPKKMLGSEAPSRARRVVHKDDIIMSTVRPNLRSFAKIPFELDNEICSTGFAVLTCPPDISPEFILQQLLSPFFVDQCMTLSTGGHYPAINDKNLSQVKIIIPNYKEQISIVGYLNKLHMQLEELKRLQAETQKELDALVPSILAKAFRGEF